MSPTQAYVGPQPPAGDSLRRGNRLVQLHPSTIKQDNADRFQTPPIDGPLWSTVLYRTTYDASNFRFVEQLRAVSDIVKAGEDRSTISAVNAVRGG